jgi:cyclopropane fatty-acyl-phospholipid synthase-like methyltransferase
MSDHPRSFWDQRYSEPGYAYGQEPNDFLREQAGRFPRGGKILCLAEGEGRNAVFLAGLGFEVTALDQSAVGLVKARALAGERGVALRTERMDLADWAPAPGSWDGIVAIWAHLPPPLRRQVHERASLALRPGGQFLLEAYTPRQLRFGTGGPRDPELLMEPAGLREEFPGLGIEILREVERDIVEGPYHQGRSASVQVLARKG